MQNVKKRAWAFVLYPPEPDGGGAPKDWEEQLRLKGLVCAVSPLHDNDKDPTGEVKKPHWHVIAVWGNTTTYNSVKTLTDSLNAPPPQPLEHVRGYYRYLTHKDNPEKAQYSEEDIKLLNGFNIADFCELSAAEVMELKASIQRLIRQYGFTEYAELMDYLLDNNMAVEYGVASNHTFFFNAYLRSRRYRSENQLPAVDPSTGEVIDPPAPTPENDPTTAPKPTSKKQRRSSHDYSAKTTKDVQVDVQSCPKNEADIVEFPRGLQTDFA